MRDFLDVEQHVRRLPSGDLHLPILYYNTTACFLSYRVRATAIQAMLPENLQALSFAGGHGLATLAFFHYVDTSVGPYNEMGLAVAAFPRGQNQRAWNPLQSLMPCMHVLDLPVTTAAALNAGRQVWGYPKTIEPIQVSIRSRQLDLSVGASTAEPIIRVHAKLGMRLPGRVPDMLTVSILNGQTLSTRIRMRGSMAMYRCSSIRTEVNGETQLAQHLHNLGLQHAYPLAVQLGQGIRAVLPEGTPV